VLRYVSAFRNPVVSWAKNKRIRKRAVGENVCLGERILHTVAIVATYNEEIHITNCIDSLTKNGLEVYVIDCESTDRTRAIAESFQGRGVIGVETFPRHGVYPWRQILERKEELAAELEADWIMHTDPDEIRLSPWAGISLAQAFEKVENAGYNAVNFFEFTFIPTLESPNHEHTRYEETMRWYYPYLWVFSVPHRLNAWRKQGRVALAWNGGHVVRFEGLKAFPQSFLTKHYEFLSVEHAIRKYCDTPYDAGEVENGWHGWRAKLRPEMIVLPSERQLRRYKSDESLDQSNPRTMEYLEALYELHVETTKSDRKSVLEEKRAPRMQDGKSDSSDASYLRLELSMRDIEIARMRSGLLDRDKEILELEAKAKDLKGELEGIKQSFGYSFMRFYSSILDRALPNTCLDKLQKTRKIIRDLSRRHRQRLES
jgi:hypothetical protein